MLTLKKSYTLLARIVVLLLLGCTIAFSAFLSPAVKASTLSNMTALAGCFPGNAQWTWTDTGHKPQLQAWLGPLEFDNTSGWHYNLHVQALCGSDYHNYHITYNKNNPKAYEWRVYDSKTGTTRIYDYPRGCGCGGGFPPIAAEVESQHFSGDVGNDAGDYNLTMALFPEAEQAFLALGIKSGDH